MAACKVKQSKYSVNPTKECRLVVQTLVLHFAAQVEEVRNPSLCNVPLGITQKYLVVTCNYPARAAGVTKLMNIAEAKQRCPGLMLVSGEDLTPYRQASKAIHAVLQRFGPAERLGMDEVYVDVTEEVDRRIAHGVMDARWHGHLHSSMTRLTSDTKYRPQDLRVTRTEVRNFTNSCEPAAVAGARGVAATSHDDAMCQSLSTTRQAASQAQPLLTSVLSSGHGRDSQHPDATCQQLTESRGHPGGCQFPSAPPMQTASRDQPPTPHPPVAGAPDNGPDCMHVICGPMAQVPAWVLRLKVGSAIAAEARRAVRQEAGFRASAGVASNKMTAKLCSGLHKPDDQTILPPSEASVSASSVAFVVSNMFYTAFVIIET